MPNELYLGLCLGMVLAVTTTLSPAAAKTNSEGVIRILCIGESYYPETSLPLLLTGDPKVQYNPLPANVGEGTFKWGGSRALRRFVRIYIPRRYEDFLDAYDLMILSDFSNSFLEPEHYHWFESSVRKEGAGLAKYELNFGMGGSSYSMDAWRSSAVYPAFPADLIDRSITPGPGRPPAGVKVQEGNLLLDLPGVERHHLFGAGQYGLETPRQGTETIAWFRYTSIPAIMIRDYGKGRCETTLAGLDYIDRNAVLHWDYYPDFFLNQFYWLAGEEIPENAVLVNTIRGGLRDLQVRTQLILSVVDFVESFGSSGRELERGLRRVEDLRDAARESYLRQDYEEASSLIREDLEAIRELEEASIRVKNRALIWIYLIEWLVVSGTGMICGLAVYTLMIRRKMYREVEVTRRSGRR